MGCLHRHAAGLSAQTCSSAVWTDMQLGWSAQTCSRAVCTDMQPGCAETCAQTCVQTCVQTCPRTCIRRCAPTIQRFVHKHVYRYVYGHVYGHVYTDICLTSGPAACGRDLRIQQAPLSHGKKKSTALHTRTARSHRRADFRSRKGCHSCQQVRAFSPSPAYRLRGRTS